jgi:hypothetical protein
MPILYIQTSGNLSTSSPSLVPMPGLWLNLPPASSTLHNALVTLNLPNPYAQGTNFPGGAFTFSVVPNNPGPLPFASFTYDSANPPASGRKPTTLVYNVPLTINQWQTVFPLWAGIRGSTGYLDSPASLSAVVA